MVFSDILSRDGWTIPEVGDCIQRFAAQTQAGDERVCCGLLAWLDAVPHVGEHATGRRFTRLQFVENSLSAAGFALTQRDFAPWFDAMTRGAAGERAGDWRPNALLPYAPQDMRLVECESRVEQLEHELHHMQVAANRARAEVNFVVAERDHYMATSTEEIHRLVSQDYENSASWRVTRPLRRAMDWSRRAKAAIRALLSRSSDVSEATQATVGDASTAATPPVVVKPKWAISTAPWSQPGYSTEAAWRVQTNTDFDRNDYAQWVRRYDTLNMQDRAEMAQRAEALASKPLISVLMTVEQADGAWLAQAVESLLAQSYPHWELCVAVAVDVDPAIRLVMEKYAGLDRRIKLVFREEAAPPALPSLRAAALNAATGDWLVFLCATDLIAAQALFVLAEYVKEHKNGQIVYSDADKLAGHSGERCAPNFKPDWDVDLFYAQNFIEHLCAFDARLVRQVGGFDARFDRAASFDLTLRCLERIQPGHIGHIPQILYHERRLEEAGSPDQADQKDRAQQRQAALNAHFARRGMAARAESAEQGLHIRYALPTPPPLVSVIIPTKNNASLLRQCMDSILVKTSYPNYEVLIVDNGSDAPDTLDYLKSLAGQPKVHVIRDNYAFNYSALNNAAVKLAKGDVIALVNDDIEVKSGDWLTEMVSHALRPGVGAVGARLWYSDLTLQHAGMVLVGGIARHVHKHLPQGEAGFCGRAVVAQSYTAVTGACLVVQKTLYDQVGGLNERELAVGFNDVDFCLRLVEAGYRNVWTPFAELFHHESATRGQDDSPEKQRRAEKELRYMRKRWGNRLDVDPAYNPNLTDGHDDFSLAWPPRARAG